MGIEKQFDVGFVARLTADEKQIQQNYRPVIGVHKWFARRPGSLFRGLLVAEFGEQEQLATEYFKSHDFSDVTIADPFMGGGTTLFEANRVGCNVLGIDINPMAFWVVRQELAAIDRNELRGAAEVVVADVEREVRTLYQTNCEGCGAEAPVKYFLWVKQQRCGGCQAWLDLFPGYLVAKNDRHTHFVLHCPGCRSLIQVKDLPEGVATCPSCSHLFDWTRGAAARNRYRCECGHEGRYPAELREQGPPAHRLFGIEYYCPQCRSSHRGRWFKTVDALDLRRFRKAVERLSKEGHRLPRPKDSIPDGDETKRLHRWGYCRYWEMFNERQLLSLGLLGARIARVEDLEQRHALLTVFSDSLRYQNMLCRYDTYALKCQDIFSVHGFPVGLVQCENNVLGIPKVGSGAFRHFVEKYDRAKAYCEIPFETLSFPNGKKRVVPVRGERIGATLVKSPSELAGGRKAMLVAGSLEDVKLLPGTLDGVFTDPPYFDNVQYAELMDFCYSWLRLFLKDELQEFAQKSTRTERELTGNTTLGRDLEHFTAGLSSVFTQAARALKRRAPFVFTYHHNDIEAYVPIVVAILDAGLSCTATFPAPAEMTASLHINGTGSSVVDTVVVCRRENTPCAPRVDSATLRTWLEKDHALLAEGGVTSSRGDMFCLALGHLARVAIAQLRAKWNRQTSTSQRMGRAESALRALAKKCSLEEAVEAVTAGSSTRAALPSGKSTQARLFD